MAKRALRISKPIELSNGRFRYKVDSYIHSKTFTVEYSREISGPEIAFLVRKQAEAGGGQRLTHTMNRDDFNTGDLERDRAIAHALRDEPELFYTEALQRMSTQDIKDGMYHDPRWLYDRGL